MGLRRSTFAARVVLDLPNVSSAVRLVLARMTLARVCFNMGLLLLLSPNVKTSRGSAILRTTLKQVVARKFGGTDVIQGRRIIEASLGLKPFNMVLVVPGGLGP